MGRLEICIFHWFYGVLLKSSKYCSFVRHAQMVFSPRYKAHVCFCCRFEKSMRNCNTLRPLRSQRHCHFWGEEVTWNKSTLVVARSWFLQNMHSCGRQNMSCIYLRFSGMRKSYSRDGIKPMCVFVVNLRNSNTLLPLWSQRHRHFWWWKSVGEL